MSAIVNRIKKFTRKEWIVISIWSFINLLFFFVLLIGAQAGFFKSLIYFLFWELVLFGYFLIRVRKGEKKTGGREWLDAMSFAVIVATIVKSFFVDAFTIPTPSMEKSMMVGDYLFVTKWNYGIRTPMTPVSFPFVHNTMPVGSGDSYSEAYQLPYYRIPGFQKIKNNDIVVFNYPGQDNRDNETRPVDKRENYIKRCVGIPGDTLSIIDGQLIINNQRVGLPEKARPQHKWLAIYRQGQVPNVKNIKAKYDIDPDAVYSQNQDNIFDSFVFDIPDHQLDNFRQNEPIDTLITLKRDIGEGFGLYFPDSYLGRQVYGWSADNFGPIYLPRKGETITLTAQNIPIYHRCITLYEGNTVDMKNGIIYINGKEATTYTFTFDYYWMMGDNRHNSLDSRSWGFVPENHIVGKAWFVWMSWDKYAEGFFNKIRWNRIFRSVH